MDLCGATAGCLLLIPLFFLVSCVVLFTLGRPVLYLQYRAGQHGIPFRLWKFRTMTDDRGPDGALLPDADRLTAVGRWLRRYSLDELPQLINVALGQMSLVGPRPLPLRYLDRYDADQRRRLDVRPGVTGWAQLYARKGASWDTRLAHDVWYVDHLSFGLDFRILCLTVLRVLRSEGAPAEDGLGPGEFWGTETPPPHAPRNNPVDRDERFPN